MEKTYRELLLKLCDDIEIWIALWKSERLRVKLDIWSAFNGYPGQIEYTAKISVGDIVAHKVSRLYSKDADADSCKEELCETLFHQTFVYGVMSAYEVSKKMGSK